MNLYPVKTLMYVGRHTPTDASFCVVEASSFDEAWEKFLNHEDNKKNFVNIEIRTKNGIEEIKFDISQPEGNTIQVSAQGFLVNKPVNIIR